MSGRCVVEAVSGGKISPASRSKRKTRSFLHLTRSLETRGLRIWREEGKIHCFRSFRDEPDERRAIFFLRD